MGPHTVGNGLTALADGYGIGATGQGIELAVALDIVGDEAVPVQGSSDMLRGRAHTDQIALNFRCGQRIVKYIRVDECMENAGLQRGERLRVDGETVHRPSCAHSDSTPRRCCASYLFEKTGGTDVSPRPSIA